MISPAVQAARDRALLAQFQSLTTRLGYSPGLCELEDYTGLDSEAIQAAFRRLEAEGRVVRVQWARGWRVAAPGLDMT